MHEVAQTFTVVDNVRQITAKKSCKSGKYGSIEHLLLLFCTLCVWLLHNHALVHVSVSVSLCVFGGAGEGGARGDVGAGCTHMRMCPHTCLHVWVFVKYC